MYALAIQKAGIFAVVGNAPRSRGKDVPGRRVIVVCANVAVRPEHLPYVFRQIQFVRAQNRPVRFENAGTSSGSAVPANPLQWSSEIYDSELDLVYYNYRHYSPALGRFLSRDPIEEQGGLNLYLFCGNDVFSFDDLGMRKRGRQFRGTRYKTRKNAKRLQISRGLAYCANYKKYRNGECCRDGKIVEDSYPKDAQPVCEGFIKDYAGTAMGESAICVAECLSQNEEEMSKISDCANRNSARFESHFACYAKCLFIPYYGLPDGGWDVGVHDLFPDYLKTRILPIFE